MKRNELIKLRELVKTEISRRDRIKELLQMNVVKEYLELTKTPSRELDSNDLKDIIEQILSSYTITKTNGIYVCTSAWYIDYRIVYEDTEYFSKSTPIDSEYAESKLYVDIESGESVTASLEEKDRRPLISDFETNNIVLNPYNTENNRNGYNEVRYDFFRTSLKDGQAKAKRLVLEKYPRIKTN